METTLYHFPRLTSHDDGDDDEVDDDNIAMSVVKEYAEAVPNSYQAHGRYKRKSVADDTGTQASDSRSSAVKPEQTR